MSCKRKFRVNDDYPKPMTLENRRKQGQGCKRHALVDGKQAVPPCTTPCFWLAMCNKTCRWQLNSRNIMQKVLICVKKSVCMGSFRRRKWISTIACHDERDCKIMRNRWHTRELYSSSCRLKYYTSVLKLHSCHIRRYPDWHYFWVSLRCVWYYLASCFLEGSSLVIGKASTCAQTVMNSNEITCYISIALSLPISPSSW